MPLGDDRGGSWVGHPKWPVRTADGFAEDGTQGDEDAKVSDL